MPSEDVRFSFEWTGEANGFICRALAVSRQSPLEPLAIAVVHLQVEDPTTDEGWHLSAGAQRDAENLSRRLLRDHFSHRDVTGGV